MKHAPSTAELTLNATLARRQRASLELLKLALPILCKSAEANRMHAQVQVRFAGGRSSEAQGWIIGSQREGDQRFSVVLMRESSLAAGRLEVRHDAAGPSTVHATVEPVYIEEQLQKHESGDVALFTEDAQHRGAAYAAIGHTLCWPVTIYQNLQFIDREHDLFAEMPEARQLLL